MCYFVGYPIKCFGYLFYKPSRNKVFVDKRAVFQERDLISKRASRSHIDLDKTQESTNKEPKVGHRIQFGIERAIKETDIFPFFL